MPYTKIASFDVEYFRIVEPAGTFSKKELPSLSPQELQLLFRHMWTIRLFDEQVIKLQRMGKCGTFASSLGQEASSIGSAFALDKEDLLVPSFREQGAFLVRGIPLHRIIQFWGGTELGSTYADPRMIFPIAVPVGSQPLHAAGAALAIKLRKEKRAVLVYFGDGATSEGDVHEALNFAGAHNLPIVFLCQNNHFAISETNSLQTASLTLAQKAIAYGFEGIKVDGNDVLAVYEITRKALEKAKEGKGPTFIECETYRMADHTTADDASRYRDPAEFEQWKRRDPIDRFRFVLKALKLHSDAWEEEVKAQSREIVEREVDLYSATIAEDPSVMFTALYKEMPASLAAQRKEFLDSGGKR